MAGVSGSASGPKRRLGVYELIAPLATGGMAELFIAKTNGVSGFEKQVALKVIHPNYSSDPDFVRMLVDEAKLAVQLQHANIVQTYDLGVVDGQYYIAMELIDGADLYKVLRTGSERGLDFPIDVATFVTSEVASGLDYAHRKNDPMGRALQIVHRDVSPQNVLISFEGEIKIVDFGIAKAALRDHQTQAGVIKGKYFYMSPEQAWGDKVDARTDVFSTGILLYEMLVGEMLYLEDDLEKLLTMVRAANIQPPSRKRPDVPPELEAIVMKALAKRPADRFQSAADLSNVLARFLRSQYPDFGRVRAARFVREVLDREPSRVDISVPPATRDDFADENSLILDLKNQRRISAKDAHRNAKPSPDVRRGDQQTRGGAPRPNDYEDTGATEIDSRALHDPSPRASIPVTDFRPSGEDSERTDLSAARGFESPDDDDEATRQRSVLDLTTSPERIRRKSVSPAPSVRRGTLSPVASPPPLPRAAMGLGVSESSSRDSSEPLTVTGVAPLVDWGTSPTTAPPVASAYVRPDTSDNSQIPASRNSPELKRKKLLAFASLLLLLALMVLVMALLWPEGPARGTIEVVSSPAGATVRIDDTVLSKQTPLRISDVERRQPHRLAVSLRGYDTWESEAKFDGSEHELRLQAVLVPAVGALTVATQPPGAEAIVNGRISGTTPTKVGDLPPNEDVTLELRLRGYKVVYKTLGWNGKRAISISVPLEKAH